MYVYVYCKYGMVAWNLTKKLFIIFTNMNYLRAFCISPFKTDDSTSLWHILRCLSKQEDYTLNQLVQYCNLFLSKLLILNSSPSCTKMWNDVTMITLTTIPIYKVVTYTERVVPKNNNSNMGIYLPDEFV